MAFQTNRDGLIREGYVYSNHAKCRGCGEEVEWYVTPKGRKMPMNLMQEGTSPAVSHFSTCKNADDFRKR